MVAVDEDGDEFDGLVAYCDAMRARGFTAIERARILETARYCGRRARQEEKTRREAELAIAIDGALDRQAAAIARGKRSR